MFGLLTLVFFLDGSCFEMQIAVLMEAMMKWIDLVALVCGSTFGTVDLANSIETISSEYSVEKTLILSVVWTESRCKPGALGTSDDRGLMQVIPRSHRPRLDRLKVTDLFDMKQNLRAGTDFLSSLNVNEDSCRALAIYNGGFKPPQRSHDYAQAVIKRKKQYDSLLSEDEEGEE